MAIKGTSGPPSKETATSAQLIRDAEHFILAATRTPIEAFFVAFSSLGFADHQTINGCERQAWIFLTKANHFPHLTSWKPTTPLRAGTYHLLDGQCHRQRSDFSLSSDEPGYR
jgi:hypothetical protein